LQEKSAAEGRLTFSVGGGSGWPLGEKNRENGKYQRRKGALAYEKEIYEDHSLGEAKGEDRKPGSSKIVEKIVVKTSSSSGGAVQGDCVVKKVLKRKKETK